MEQKNWQQYVLRRQLMESRQGIDSGGKPQGRDMIELLRQQGEAPGHL